MNDKIKAMLSNWLLNDKRSSEPLAVEGVASLDPLVDPDTSTEVSGVYFGHVPYISQFTTIDQKLTLAVENIRQSLQWGGENKYCVEIPLFDQSYVKDDSVRNQCIEIKLITGDAFDKLVFDTGHIDKYMVSFSEKVCDASTFDKGFAVEHHLDIYTQTTVVDFAPGDFGQDTTDALVYFNELILKHFNDKLLGIQVTPTSA